MDGKRSTFGRIEEDAAVQIDGRCERESIKGPDQVTNGARRRLRHHMESGPLPMKGGQLEIRR